MKTRKYLKAKDCPDLGQQLRARIKQRRITIASLARVVQRHPTTIQKYLQRKSLQTNILWELSKGMKHNFFADLAAQLPEDFTTNAPDATAPLQERIATLEEENKLLTTKLEELRAVLRKS